MLSNQATTETRRRVKNYKREKQRKGKCFQWKRFGVGRVALCLIVLIGEEKVKCGDVHCGKFREAGLTKEWLYNELCRLLPCIKNVYRFDRGEELTPSIVMNRYYKAVGYQTKPGAGNSHTVGGASTEHPRNHLVLIPLVSYVDKLFKRNTPIKPHEVSECCIKCGIKFGKN